MVELNHRERTIQVKIVYYGPALGGKTTNLQVLHQIALGDRRGELVSLDSAQDRTILFDLLPLKAMGFRGFDLKLQLLAVPGQAMYAATRKLILKAADALVFVANSAADRQEENRRSFQEMTQNLLTLQLDPATMPLVFQYNKRDLPEVAGLDALERTLNARQTQSVAAVAIRSEGVLETFTAVLRLTMQDLAARYRMLDVGKGQTVAEWTEKAIEGMFGPPGVVAAPLVKTAPPAAPAPVPPAVAASAAPPAPSAEAENGRSQLRAVLPAEIAGRAAKGPDARANAALVETYAEASEALARSLTKSRDEREVAARRLADLREAVGCARDLLAGRPIEPVLAPLLRRIVEATRARQASFLVPETETTQRLAASWALAGEDPLLRSKPGRVFLAERPVWDAEPRLHEAADHLDLADALESVGLGGLVAVPVRTPRALQGLIVLYLTPDGARPGADELAHLGTLGQAVAAPLELAGAVELLHGPEGALGLAALGEAAGPAMQSLLERLQRLNERFAALRHRTDAPPWLLDELTLSLPELETSAATARSLLSLSRGTARREPVELEDVWRPLRDGAITFEAPADLRQFPGDLHLVRLAVTALVARHRGTAGAKVAVRAAADPMWVRIGVEGSAAAEPRPNDPKIVLARRVAEMHGGGLDAEAGGRLTLRVPRSTAR